jgi:hypothetical protein
MGRKWLVVVLALFAAVSGVVMNAQQSPTAQGSGSGQTAAATGRADFDDPESQQQQRELGDEDLTYFRTRTTVKYDHKWVPNDGARDRFRSFSLVSFGPNKSWAFTAELAFVVHVATPKEETTGVGDLEFKFGKMITKGNGSGRRLQRKLTCKRRRTG